MKTNKICSRDRECLGCGCRKECKAENKKKRYSFLEVFGLFIKGEI